jgi:hypothetical protein
VFEGLPDQPLQSNIILALIDGSAIRHEEARLTFAHSNLLQILQNHKIPSTTKGNGADT